MSPLLFYYYRRLPTIAPLTKRSIATADWTRQVPLPSYHWYRTNNTVRINNYYLYHPLFLLLLSNYRQQQIQQYISPLHYWKQIVSIPSKRAMTDLVAITDANKTSNNDDQVPTTTNDADPNVKHTPNVGTADPSNTIIDTTGSTTVGNDVDSRNNLIAEDYGKSKRLRDTVVSKFDDDDGDDNDNQSNNNYDDDENNDTTTGRGSKRTEKRKRQRKENRKGNNRRKNDNNDNDTNTNEEDSTSNEKPKFVPWNTNTEPNTGSYATKEMQQLLNIVLPKSSLLVSDDNNTPPPSTIKRKVAFLLAYVGTNYGGFQMNTNQRTLQAEFEVALYKCNLLHPNNFGFPNKYSWSTSGRTDKGVHACAQVVSAKIELIVPNNSTNSNTMTTNDKDAVSNDTLKDEHTTLDSVRSALNAVLPNDFQVLDIVRTTRNFCAKTGRDRVRYQYMIPSFVLLHPTKVRAIFDKLLLLQQQQEQSKPSSSSSQSENFIPMEVIRAAQKELYKTRVTKEQLQLLQQSLSCYVGTHSFHNFSRRVSAEEARSARYIVSFTVEEPIIYPTTDDDDSNVVDGIEWIPTNVVGQSFLLNQIRKMVCLAIDVTRGVGTTTSTTRPINSTNETDEQTTIDNEQQLGGTELIKRALQRDSDVRIAQAPAQGLFLEMSYYDAYNRKIQKTNPDLPPLHWSSLSIDGTSSATTANDTVTNYTTGTDDKSSKNTNATYQRWKSFRNDVIMKHINDEERKEGNFVSYLYTQEYIFNYKTFYGLSDGVPPR